MTLLGMVKGPEYALGHRISSVQALLSRTPSTLA
jgi:hypothetical protein